MVLACWVLGKYSIDTFPRLFVKYRPMEVLVSEILVLVFLIIPLTFMALGMSQYSRRGCIKLWDAAPVWRGIGVAGIICLYLNILHDITLCTYFLYYTIHSLQTEIPWLKCGIQNFESKVCFTFSENRSIHLDCAETFNEEHCSKIIWKNSAEFFWDYIAHTDRENPASEYFRFSLIPYEVAVIIMIYICIRSSAKSLEIFTPFLVIFPTILHGILLIKSFLHPGTLRSLEAIFNFHLVNITHFQFWIDIVIISLSSIGFAYGGLFTFGRHHQFRNATNSEAIFINLASVVYSLLYSVFLYNIHGILSYEWNVPLDYLFSLSPLTNFIQLPLGFSHWTMIKFWTFCFYLSNFLIILRSLLTQCEVILNILYEAHDKLKLYTIPCALGFSSITLGLIIAINFDVAHEFFDNTNKLMSFILFPLLAFYSSIFISFFYGVQHFVDDMHFMLGFRPTNAWKLSWYVGFIIYFVSFIYGFLIYKDLFMSTPPVMKYCIATILSTIGIIPLLYFLILVIVRWQKNLSVLEAFRPLKNWGPNEEILRKSRDMFSAHDMTKEYLYRQQRLKYKPDNPF